jgi:aryl-alcohol dehydrogenase-like predicted oxidoreductase
VLYVHFWDYSTPPRELMSALNVLVEQGKVLYLAISDAPAWVVAQCNGVADQYGWAKFCMYQGQLGA